MPITRPHVCELTLAYAQPDDHGNVLAAASASTPLTPDEARELAAELTAAAQIADDYRSEQGVRA